MPSVSGAKSSSPVVKGKTAQKKRRRQALSAKAKRVMSDESSAVQRSSSKANRVGQLQVIARFSQLFTEAQQRSMRENKVMSFRVSVTPEGLATTSPLEEGETGESSFPSNATEGRGVAEALENARRRGRRRVVEILAQDEMLSAEAFADLLGVTRATVNSRRQQKQLLGLEGVKRGFRYPSWQLDETGKPYPEIVELHEKLGEAWSVYRFLSQSHGSLEGVTGRDALRDRKTAALLKAAEGVARGDFV